MLYIYIYYSFIYTHPIVTAVIFFFMLLQFSKHTFSRSFTPFLIQVGGWDEAHDHQIYSETTISYC